MDYLNQISSGVPQKSAPTSLFGDAKIRLVAIIGGILILVAIILMTLSNSSAPVDASTELTRLYSRSDAILEQIVRAYSSSIKSSKLRADSSSLESVLLNARQSSESFLANLEAKPEKTLTAEDSELVAGTVKTLTTAQLNGQLDRYYASELVFQIKHLLILESSIRSKTSDPNLTNFLNSSYDNLERLQVNFSTFSES